MKKCPVLQKLQNSMQSNSVKGILTNFSYLFQTFEILYHTTTHGKLNTSKKFSLEDITENVMGVQLKIFNLHL